MKDFIKFPAALVPATFDDVFTPEQLPRENKMFYVKYPGEASFRGYYIVRGTDNYTVIEVKNALNIGILYVLAPLADDRFCFKLFCRPAEDFDFFCGAKFLNHDVVYYTVDSTGVAGPYLTGAYDNMETFSTGIANKSIYVPCKKQSFELFKRLKTA